MKKKNETEIMPNCKILSSLDDQKVSWVSN